nr:acyltransferase domain-containing protein [Streptomyces typhae]
MPSAPFHPNPEIDFDTGPIRPAVAAESWPETGGPRRAAVSAFGVGGTNAHAILQEPPPPPTAPPARAWQLVALSAGDESALDELAGACGRALGDVTDEQFPAVARTPAEGRRRLPARRAGVYRDRAHALAEPGTRPGPPLPPAGGRAGEVAFVLPGGGSQYAGMGRGLHRDEPVFRETVDTCLALLPEPDGETARSLRGWWAGDDAGTGAAALGDTDGGPAGDVVDDPRTAFPAVFITQIALARLLRAFGVTPSVLMGHSLGEYAAAQPAGVLSLPDALRLVCARGALLSDLSDIDNGAMLIVRADAADTAPWQRDGVGLAVVNGPGACVLSGPAEAIGRTRRHLAAAGVDCGPLPLATAAHSTLVEPVLDRFREVVRDIALTAPDTELISAMTGTADAPFTDPEHWVRHLRGTVRFDAGLARLRERDPRLVLEVGPGTTLTTLARAQGLPRAVPLTRHPLEERDDREVLLAGLARAWEAVIDVDLSPLWPRPGQRLPVAPYPFARIAHRPARAPSAADGSRPRAPDSP